MNKYTKILLVKYVKSPFSINTHYTRHESSICKNEHKLSDKLIPLLYKIDESEIDLVLETIYKIGYGKLLEKIYKRTIQAKQTEQTKQTKPDKLDQCFFKLEQTILEKLYNHTEEDREDYLHMLKKTCQFVQIVNPILEEMNIEHSMGLRLQKIAESIQNIPPKPSIKENNTTKLTLTKLTFKK